jgi:hypothetical protein
MFVILDIKNWKKYSKESMLKKESKRVRGIRYQSFFALTNRLLKFFDWPKFQISLRHCIGLQIFFEGGWQLCCTSQHGLFNLSYP